MTDPYETWTQRLGRWNPAMHAAALSALLTSFMALAAAVGWMLHGAGGVAAAVAATGVCLVAGWVAMCATHYLTSPAKPAAQVLLGMAFRMGIPLFACLLLSQQQHWLLDVGFGGFLIAAFTIALTVETLFAVSRLKVDQTALKGPGSPDFPRPPGT